MKLKPAWFTKILEPLETELKQYEIGALDLETNPDGTIAVVGYFDERGFRHFDHIIDFLHWYLVPGNVSRICYAHNGSGFDFQFLIGECPEDFRYEWVLQGGKLISGKFTRKRREIWRFCDSLQLFQGMSLDRLGKMVLGEGKSGHHSQSGADLLKYNERDCYILYQSMRTFQQVAIDMGFQMKATAAGSASDYLLRNLPQAIEIPRGDLFSRAYFGGRVLLLQPRYSGPGFSVDFNSLYPWAMSQPLPVGKPRVFTHCKRELIEEIHAAGNTGFCQCSVTLDMSDVPSLPYRSGARNLYPIGKLTGLWAIPELLALRETDRITVRRAYVFQGNPWLKPIIEPLYQRRLMETSDVMKTAMKIPLNSCYGKFAQHTDTRTLVSQHNNPADTFPLKLQNGKISIIPVIEGEIEPELKSPATAAYVTALARMRWNQIIGPYQDRCLYLDTDSAYMMGEVSDYPFPISKNLGDLKVEETFDEFYGIAPKLYGIHTASGWKIHAKGYPVKGRYDAFGNENGNTLLFDDTGAHDIADNPKQYLEAIAAGCTIKRKRPVSFIIASRLGTTAGYWETLARSQKTGPESGRVWIPGMIRTSPPFLDSYEEIEQSWEEVEDET